MNIANTDILFLVAPALFITSLLSQKSIDAADRIVHFPLFATIVSLPIAMLAALWTTEKMGIIVLCVGFVGCLAAFRFHHVWRARRAKHAPQ